MYFWRIFLLSVTEYLTTIFDFNNLFSHLHWIKEAVKKEKKKKCIKRRGEVVYFSYRNLNTFGTNKLPKSIWLLFLLPLICPSIVWRTANLTINYGNSANIVAKCQTYENKDIFCGIWSSLSQTKCRLIYECTLKKLSNKRPITDVYSLILKYVPSTFIAILNIENDS